MLAYVVYRVLRSARTIEDDSQDDAVASDAAEAAAADRSRVQELFREGFALLQQQTPHRDYRYRKPWYLYLSDGDPGLSFAADESGRESPLSWRVTDRAVLLMADREYFQARSPGAEAAGRWRKLLQEIEAHRPERPLDGLIVTLQASRLLRANELAQEGFAKLKQRADLYRSMLQDLWQRLGMQIPLYVVVAGCEKVDGFDAFWEALPPGDRQQAFGWSSPFRLDAAYEPDWVEQAFTSVGQQLRFTQLDMLSASHEPKDRDQLFLFPARLERLRLPARTFLARILQPMAHDDAFLFRGLYFTGLGRDASLPEEDRTLFAGELFSHKIFPEWGMGTPIPRSFKRVNKWAQATRLVVAFFLAITLFACFWTYPDLKGDRDTLLAMFNTGCEGLRELKRADCEPRGTPAADEGEKSLAEQLDEREQALFESMRVPLEAPERKCRGTDGANTG